MTVGDLIKRLSNYPKNGLVQVTVRYPCGCGKGQSETVSEIKVDKYFYLPKENYPESYWTQILVELEDK
jgi:hypothetical protein